MNAAHLALILAPLCAGLVVCAVGWLRAERRARRYWQLVQDDCETDENVRDLARPVIGRMLTDGDSYAVPPLEEIFTALVCRVKFLEANPPLPRVLRVELLNPHHRADVEKEFIRVTDIDGKPATYAFTDASRVQAILHGHRIEADLADGRAKILPPA